VEYLIEQNMINFECHTKNILPIQTDIKNKYIMGISSYLDTTSSYDDNVKGKQLSIHYNSKDKSTTMTWLTRVYETKSIEIIHEVKKDRKIIIDQS
jgi:hypothetical protein